MSLVMAENSQPVFRDFLGTGQRSETKQPEMSVTDSVRISQNSAGIAGCDDGEVSTRACFKYSAPGLLIGAGPLSFPNSSDPTSEIWRHLKAGAAGLHGSQSFAYKGFEHDHRKKRDILASRDLLRSSLQLNSQALESSRPSKVSRFKEKDDPTRGHGDPSSFSADFGLSMQPPRGLPSGPLWMQTSVFKTDLSTGASKWAESSSPVVLNSALPVGRGLNIAVASGGNPPKENAVGVALPQPPADEGSRTGLQGKGIAHLLNTCTTKLVAGDSSAQGAVPLQSKVPSRNSDSAIPSSHQSPAPTTRQLTIFYGGQAHVFDDVSSDKADAIMLLAGSSGRSWSTTYAHRPSASNHSAASEGLELESQKSKPVSCEASLKKQGNHALPSDIRSSLQGLTRAGIGVQPGNQYCRQNPISAMPSLGIQKTAENFAADASKIDGSVIRIATSAAAFANTARKEVFPAGCQGQQWI